MLFILKNFDQIKFELEMENWFIIFSSIVFQFWIQEYIYMVKLCLTFFGLVYNINNIQHIFYHNAYYWVNISNRTYHSAYYTKMHINSSLCVQLNLLVWPPPEDRPLPAKGHKFVYISAMFLHPVILPIYSTTLRLF